MADIVRSYICTGCGIGECLDVQKLVEAAREESRGEAVAHSALCVPEGLEFLREDLKNNPADTPLIAACSDRVNWDVFSPESLQTGTVERVDIREQVAWSKDPNTEETQALAEDYLRMGIVRAQKSQAPEARTIAVDRTLLVVGGGVAGLTAAIEAATAGSNVLLVEKEPALGGRMARFPLAYPDRPPYQALQQSGIDELVQAVQQHPRIRVATSTLISRISGQPGALAVELENEGAVSTESAGAVVVAAGWQPHDLSGASHLGYSAFADVIDSIAMEELAKHSPIVRPSDGRPVRQVLFIQNPRPKGESGYSYSSAVNDLVMLKQVDYVRRANPEAVCYVIYDHMITPGQMETYYRTIQESPNVLFSKGEVSRITEDSSGQLRAEVDNTLLGGSIEIGVDLVVLSTGMVPNSLDSSILQLEYRQGKELPVDARGFADSNYICFPYETRRTGFYAAGCVREAMDSTAAREDATGAALKAIQSLQQIAQGGAVHPRTSDLSLPTTLLQGCTQCGRCSEECPFGAIEVDERRYPQLNPSRCRRCGICMGACPVRVISFENYSVDQLFSMIKAIRFPDDDNIPRILAFVCENDAQPAFDLAGANGLKYDASVRVIPLRCLGSLNIVLVTDALARGIDGVMLMGCKTGDDYQCHFIHGSELAMKRMANIQETLTRQMLEPERVVALEMEITDYRKIPDAVDKFAQDLRAMGPNPYRGF